MFYRESWYKTSVVEKRHIPSTSGVNRHANQCNRVCFSAALWCRTFTRNQQQLKNVRGSDTKKGTDRGTSGFPRLKKKKQQNQLLTSTRPIKTWLFCMCETLGTNYEMQRLSMFPRRTHTRVYVIVWCHNRVAITYKCFPCLKKGKTFWQYPRLKKGPGLAKCNMVGYYQESLLKMHKGSKFCWRMTSQLLKLYRYAKIEGIFKVYINTKICHQEETTMLPSNPISIQITFPPLLFEISTTSWCWDPCEILSPLRQFYHKHIKTQYKLITLPSRKGSTNEPHSTYRNHP